MAILADRYYESLDLSRGMVRLQSETIRQEAAQHEHFVLPGRREFRTSLNIESITVHPIGATQNLIRLE